MEGNIVVDGVLASCYASVDHDLVHLGLSPMRLFPKIVELIFGNDIRSPGFQNVVIELAGWLMPYEQMSWMK